MKNSGFPLALLLLHAIIFSQQPRADLVVINAKVRTMTARDAVAEAFAVSGNRITDVDTNKVVKSHIGPSTVVIDARGRLVVPGFDDAHVHFMAIGNRFSSIDLRNVKSGSEMLARIAQFVKFLPKGRWILGGHFKDDDWDLPDRRSVDAVAPDNPVFLYRSGAATAFANTLALRFANISSDTGGDDRTKGIVRGAALKTIASVVPLEHIRNWFEIGETATNYAASLGVTSVQDMHSDDSREVYRELQRRGKLKTRVYDCLPLRDWRKLTGARIPSAAGDLVTDGCLKGFSDGDDGGKAALLREVLAADKAGLQIMIHAIGSAANHIVIDVFEQVERTNGFRDRRFRVEHAYNATDADIPRIRRSNIIASMQPFLFESTSGSRYGTLLGQKASVAFGSDASMVDLNPLLGIHAAVNADREAISVYDAVQAYTIGSAYAEFKEKEKGTIEPGKLADFVILSDDIFTIDRRAVSGVKVMLTVVDGKIVYQSN